MFGWDFYQNDNTPDPAGLHDNDNHGTAVAGVAAAAGNNSLGVAGASLNSKVMALKIAHGANLWTSTMLADAIQYAAGRVYNAGTSSWTNNTWGGGGRVEYEPFGERVFHGNQCPRLG